MYDMLEGTVIFILDIGVCMYEDCEYFRLIIAVDVQRDLGRDSCACKETGRSS